MGILQLRGHLKKYSEIYHILIYQCPVIIKQIALIPTACVNHNLSKIIMINAHAIKNLKALLAFEKVKIFTMESNLSEMHYQSYLMR